MKKPMQFLGRILASILMLFSVLISFAQDNNMNDISTTHLIKDVHIISAPGAEANFGNILIEDGIIKHTGTNFAIPANAIILEGDSMYVYAGFIDALSHTAIPKKEDKERNSKVEKSWDPTNVEAGIVPENSAYDLISSGDKSISSMRKNGFTVAHSVPKGKMFPGQGVIILLTGSNVDDMLIARDKSVYAQLAGSGRMYPSTTIGAMAKFRELLTNASNASAHQKNYEANPSGMKRPNYDQAIKALIPVTQKEKPLYFRAEKVRNIQRVLNLQKELGFNLVLAELEQSWPLLSKIKAGNFACLLSYDIPESDKKDKEKKDGKEKPEDADASKDESKEEEVKDLEKEALIKRKEESIIAYQSQAAKYEEANIKFAFSNLGGIEKDMKKNLLLMMEQGLSEDAALAALTTNPADILGIESICGTITPGKLANLVISDKPFFEKESSIQYVFVEGDKYEYKSKKKKKNSDGAEPTFALEGTWSFELDIPGQQATGKMVVTKEDGVYKAELAQDDDPSDIERVDDMGVDGNKAIFSFTSEDNGFEMVIDFDITFEEGSFSGTVSVGEFGSFAITGTKEDDPK